MFSHGNHDLHTAMDLPWRARVCDMKCVGYKLCFSIGVSHGDRNDNTVRVFRLHQVLMPTVHGGNLTLV